MKGFSRLTIPFRGGKYNKDKAEKEKLRQTVYLLIHTINVNNE
jgi:hypothetical protein